MEIDEIANESTKEPSKTIIPIDSETVQKICSGQVIVSLAIAVKELVENALDAGATIVEVKLKEYGLELIEVSDNGCGVEEKDFEGMTSRHATSKLANFNDLEKVETFGFRGEALNSLCALADMIIITRHRSVEVGTKLELDHKGTIIKKIPHARQIGTTVTMTNLFATLPVRKKDYTKNIKKEFTKMCQILQAYCLVSVGVRIICTNQTSKGSRNTFMCTNGSPKVTNNIQAIFGSKQLSEIIEIKSALDENKEFTKEMLLEQCLQNEDNFNVTQDDIERLNRIKFKIIGWISNCQHGSGRSSKDRQYYFINSRPCDPKNIIKLVNDVYHRYNSHQYPFVFLNIILDKSEIDVNLTPDKRMLLLCNEKIFLLILKSCLIRTFESIPSSFKVQNTSIQAVSQKEKSIKIKPSDGSGSSQENSQKSTDNPYEPVCKMLKRKSDKEIDEISELNKKIKSIHSVLSQSSSKTSLPSFICSSFPSKDKFYSCESEDSSNEDNENSISTGELSSNFNLNQLQIQSQEFDLCTQKSSSEIAKTSNSLQKSDDILVKKIDCKNISTTSTQSSARFIFEKRKPSLSNDLPDDITNNYDDDDQFTQVTVVLDNSDDDNDEENEIQYRMQQTVDEIDVTIDEIRNLVLKEEEFQDNLKNEKQLKLKRLKFNAEINPDKNKKAEEELEREIHKDSFKKMEIIGQFNLGFIIVKLNENLFIIDQHATDEKYNYEMLQKTTSLQYQPLTVPQTLDLTAVNEMILIDNIKTFEANGFKFQIDENAPVTRKVKLIGKPFSKNWEFGKEDIDELIFMIQDAPEDIICRPSRIRLMFASRACRKSIMIGKSLSKSLMRKLVDHMGEIDHPWNCPHGRPTMRHLVDLEMLKDENESD